MAKIGNKQFIYNNVIEWQADMKGLISSHDKPNLQIATPPEFRGHPGIWSPEDLFVASINSCIMTTFLYYAQKENLEFLSYKSEAKGILERVENQLIFSEVTVKPQILVKQDIDIQKARNLVELSEKNCLISNSIKSRIVVHPEIKIGA